MKLKAGTGFSKAPGASDAGREAAAMALAALGGTPPALILVFTTPRYDLHRLLAAIRSATGDTPLLGATSSGEIVQGNHLGFGGGVAVLALSAGPYRFGIASASGIKGSLDQAGQDLARKSWDAAGPSNHAALILLADSMLGDLQHLVLGTYRVTGPGVPVVGGAASDEQKFVATYLFHNDKVIEQGAAALWVASPHRIEVVTRHGWSPMTAPLLVTKVDGADLLELGGRPAAAVYEERIGVPPGNLTADTFWNTSILHPFGLLQPDGSTLIRMARSKTAEGGLHLVGCVPPDGSAVQVMRGSADTLMAVSGEVARAAIEGNADAGVLLVFSCAARANIFKERTGEEARRLQEAAGRIPVFGMHCCGEFARVVGVLGTHNATITAVAL